MLNIDKTYYQENYRSFHSILLLSFSNGCTNTESMITHE